MPTLSRENLGMDDDDEDEDYEDSQSPTGSPSLQRKSGAGQRSRSSTTWGSRPASSNGPGGQRTKSLHRPVNMKGGVTVSRLLFFLISFLNLNICIHKYSLVYAYTVFILISAPSLLSTPLTFLE